MYEERLRVCQQAITERTSKYVCLCVYQLANGRHVDKVNATQLRISDITLQRAAMINQTMIHERLLEIFGSRGWCLCSY